ncbi:hypothetical protein V495_03408 [Pseudogymnoascus sp. VKM F-4514 (FW-929)]|nr:hypothetical protein V495_03408 [Pseudogymnoascus sp. VKM F-4514 (FW-929)]KFY58905.1 hypothetical protein V497_04621 [Pseudogymnoascus sp. VKM F-4516 (FW-969)]
MKFSTTLILLSTAILGHAATILAEMAGSLETRDTCSPSGDGRNTCGYGRECDGPGIYTCSPAGIIVAIACCGPNGCKEINGQYFCV